jgi:hypothetical protein
MPASELSYTPSGQALEELPPIGQVKTEDARRWFQDRIQYTHHLRSRDAATWRRSELYDQNYQWLFRALAGYDVGGTVSQWVQAYWDKNDPNYVPTPVFNEGLGARQNESARLASPNPRPKITPRSKQPEQQIRQGSKLATDMARHRLRFVRGRVGEERMGGGLGQDDHGSCAGGDGVSEAPGDRRESSGAWS